MGRKKRNDLRVDAKPKKSEIILQCERLFQITSEPLLPNQLWENYLEISTILEKIESLEESKINPTKRDHAVDQFLNWLKQHGAQISGVSIQNFTGYGMGLQAELDFKENELILEIPRRLIFSTYTAAPELDDIKTDMMIRHLPQVALALALLIEKNKSDSKWRPYLNILPKQYSTILYMNKADMLELKGSPTLESALKQCRNIARQYSYFKRLFQNNKNSISNLLRNSFTYDEYRWAVSTVMTRQNIIPNETNLEPIHTLIPMWDMCNHEEGKITTNFDVLSNSCKCHAMRNFKAGEQIFIYYGSRTNAEFFVHSGFVYSENKNDKFLLRLGISKEDPLYNQRIDLLSQIDLSPVNDFLLKPNENPLTGLLLGFLRIFTMNKDELDTWLKCNSICDITKSNCELTETVDKRILSFIITRLKLLLTKYRISQEDELTNTTLQHNRKLVVQMLLSERKILQSILSVLENC